MTTDKILELAHSCISSYKGDHTFECTSGDLVYFAASVINAEREKYQKLIAAAEAIVMTQDIYGGIPTKMVDHLRELLERMKEKEE